MEIKHIVEELRERNKINEFFQVIRLLYEAEEIIKDNGLEMEIDEDYKENLMVFLPLKIKYNNSCNGWLSVKKAGALLKIIQDLANWWREFGFIRIYKVDPHYVYIHLIRIEK